jgi:hypothetical protein
MSQDIALCHLPMFCTLSATTNTGRPEARIAARDRLSTRCIACAKEKRWSSVTLDAWRAAR